MKRQWRIFHKYVGLISCIFILIVSSTAVALNHHDLYSSVKTIKTTFDPQNIKHLAYDPFDSQHIIASDENKALFQSKNLGVTWQKMEMFVPTEKINGIEFDTFEKDKIYVSLKEAGLYVSDDGGEVWEEITLPFFPNEGENIENISVSKNAILVKSRFALYNFDTLTNKWNKNPFMLEVNKKATLNLEETIYNLHTGKFFSDYGVYLYDIISLCLVFLSISGIYLSIRLKPIKVNR